MEQNQALPPLPFSKLFFIATIIINISLSISFLVFLFAALANGGSAEIYGTVLFVYAVTIFVPGLLLFLAYVAFLIVVCFMRKFTFVPKEKKALIIFGVLVALNIIALIGGSYLVTK